MDKNKHDNEVKNMAELPTVLQIDKVKYINLAKIINYISSRREYVYQLYVTYGESAAADTELRAIEKWIMGLEKEINGQEQT